MQTDDFFCSRRDGTIEQGSRMKSGNSAQKVWLEIQNPTDNDKGKYILTMSDGTETHQRSLDLSGQGGAKKELKGLLCAAVDVLRFFFFF